MAAHAAPLSEGQEQALEQGQAAKLAEDPVPEDLGSIETVDVKTMASFQKNPLSEHHTKMHEAAKAAQASFKRPATWVLIFGWSLAICAGLANSVAFCSWGVFVANMSGATTTVGIQLEGYHMGRHTFERLSRTILTILCFATGAFLCGLLIDKNQVHFGGKSLYGFALLGNCVLFLIATALSPHWIAVLFAAGACGLQNAMCTSHFGAVVRTTHVTGTLTDIGSTLGRLAMIFLRRSCRRSRLTLLDHAEVGVDARKLLVLLPLYSCFLVGCIIGAYLYSAHGDYAFIVPAAVTGCVGFCYACFRQKLKDQIKKMERDRLSNDLAEVESCLERTHSFMHALQQAEQENGSRDGHLAVIDLEQEVSHMLEVVQDVEASLGQLYPARSRLKAAPDVWTVDRKKSRHQTAHF